MTKGLSSDILQENKRPEKRMKKLIQYLLERYQKDPNFGVAAKPHFKNDNVIDYLEIIIFTDETGLNTEVLDEKEKIKENGILLMFGDTIREYTEMCCQYLMNTMAEDEKDKVDYLTYYKEHFSQAILEYLIQLISFSYYKIILQTAYSFHWKIESVDDAIKLMYPKEIGEGYFLLKE